MNLLDVFSLAERIWPRLVGIAVVVALIVFPQTATSIVWRVAREKGAQITSLLEHAIDPMLWHGSHSHGCQAHVRCQPMTIP